MQYSIQTPVESHTLPRDSMMTQMFTPLTSIREVSGSNLGTDTDYPGCFSSISSVPTDKFRDST
jgi:hypothetical protein